MTQILLTIIMCILALINRHSMELRVRQVQEESTRDENEVHGWVQGGEQMTNKKEPEDYWGVSSSIDIYGCDKDLMTNREAIKTFVIKLCDVIEMKRFGDPIIEHFGEDKRIEGFSMAQLIETSLISAHFANELGTVYLDVFSCKPYNVDKVVDFSKTFFKGKETRVNTIYRK